MRRENELVHRQAIDNTEERKKITHKRRMNEWAHKTKKKNLKKKTRATIAQ
jgi:hypothetical protein